MDKEIFGNFIATARHDLGMTQQALANQLHVTDKAVSKWERGLCFPDVTMLESLAKALGLTVGELMACEKHREEPLQKEADMHSLLEIASESQKRQKKRTWLLASMLGLVSILLVGLTVLFAVVNSSGSRYVSFAGKKANAEGYFVYVEEGDRLLCLRCPDRQMYDTIQADKHQFYSIQYRWNRLTYKGTLQTCRSEGEREFFTPMEEIGSSQGIDSLLGIPCAIIQVINAYPDPDQQGKYLWTYRFYYKGNGSSYYLGVDMPETQILTVEDCRSFKAEDYDGDGIAELFVLTKYEDAPYLLYELQDGKVVFCFVDEVPASVLEWFTTSWNGL